MKVIKALFAVAAFGLLGLVVLGLVVGHVFAPSDAEMAKYRADKQAQEKQQEEESRARVTAALKQNLEDNRTEIIREIRALIDSKEYALAKRKADRFQQFDDSELTELSELAASRLAAALQAQQQEEQRRSAAALQKMSKKTDSIEGIDWYRDKSSPSHNNANAFYLYIGKRESRAPWLRLRVQYHADKWLFISSFIVIADGKRFERSAAKFERDHSAKIWEWLDETPTAADLAMIDAIIKSKDAVIRFNGRQYYADRPITAAQKAALQNVLDAYKALGGK